MRPIGVRVVGHGSGAVVGVLAGLAARASGGGGGEAAVPTQVRGGVGEAVGSARRGGFPATS